MKADAAKEGEDNPAAIALMLPMIEMMADMMAIQIGDGTMSMLSPEGEEKSTFKILESDEATGDFKILVAKAGEDDEENPGNIKGNTMTINDDGKSIVMNRIDDAEFTRRQKKIKDFERQYRDTLAQSADISKLCEVHRPSLYGKTTRDK